MYIILDMPPPDIGSRGSGHPAGVPRLQHRGTTTTTNNNNNNTNTAATNNNNNENTKTKTNDTTNNNYHTYKYDYDHEYKNHNTNDMPNLPTNIVNTNIARLKLSGNSL